MSLEIAFRDRDGYFLAEVSGTFTWESALAMYEKILIYSTVKKESRILIDCRGIAGEMPVNEILAFSQRSADLQSDYMETGMVVNMRTAYLFDPEHHDLAQLSLGVYDPSKEDLILTLDYDKAVNWLNSL
ncbi:MAG: hypothetical protein ACMUHU_04835 [Thermoplasmatota archaeon]